MNWLELNHYTMFFQYWEWIENSEVDMQKCLDLVFHFFTSLNTKFLNFTSQYCLEFIKNYWWKYCIWGNLANIAMDPNYPNNQYLLQRWIQLMIGNLRFLFINIYLLKWENHTQGVKMVTMLKKAPFVLILLIGET